MKRRFPAFVYRIIDWLNSIDDRQPARAARGELGDQIRKGGLDDK